MDRFFRIRNGLQVDGKTSTVNSVSVSIKLIDSNEDILWCSGVTVPTADSSGFAKGCLFIKTDAADGTKGLYENACTRTACDFNKIGDITSAEIGDGAITLAKLASAVASSHVIKFVKLGSEITGVALTGLVVGDLVISILADGTVTVAACAVADTLPADPADTTYLIVLRATA